MRYHYLPLVDWQGTVERVWRDRAMAIGKARGAGSGGNVVTARPWWRDQRLLMAGRDCVACTTVFQA